MKRKFTVHPSSITAASRKENSPKKYVYDICDHLGWRPPMYIDSAAGGYRIRYTEASEEEAQQTVDEIKQAAHALGIRVVRALVKPAWRGEWYAYVVVPRYEG